MHIIRLIHLALTAPLATAASSILTEVREHWMRRAIAALTELVSPCPSQAFGAAVVNHTGSNNGYGDLICIGANSILFTGDPTLHGEIAAMRNCTFIFTDPNGPYKFDRPGAIAAFRDLTMYTTGEPCPMCATAMRRAAFKECVFATSVPTLVDLGWAQSEIRTKEVYDRSTALGRETVLLEGVLANETDPLFAWQFDDSHPCPAGCGRDKGSGTCVTLENGYEELYKEGLGGLCASGKRTNVAS